MTMETKENSIVVPKFYRPRPYQQASWRRRQSGEYALDFKLWCRQAGKDTDDIEWLNRRAWDTPGSQSAYIGLDNVWITNNIFKKTIDNRTFWADYPEEFIQPKDTAKEVLFLNNPPGIAPARIKFIGFLNDQQLIGSSYDNWIFSEASLYGEHAFQFVEPIWERKAKSGVPFFIGFNGTPRGTRNVLWELLRTYTKVDDPEKIGGSYVIPSLNNMKCHVDIVTIHDLEVSDGHGGWKKMYEDEEIEQLKDRYLRAYGNLNLYYQENECKFTTVNAGLVYLGIEQLMGENRYRRFALDSHYPVYVAFDIASKAKITDATAAIVFQYINRQLFIYDVYEARSKSLVECVADMSTRDYFKYIRMGFLPWDSERSASSETPIEEVQKMFGSIKWHALDKERVDRGINLVRQMLPNTFINSDKCSQLIDCFMNYEYKRLEAQDDWAARPKHSKYSHLMDALRYGVMGLNEMQYLGMSPDGSINLEATNYSTMHWKKPAPQDTTMRKAPKEDQSGYYRY